MRKKNVIMEILKRDEIILMHSLTQAAYIFILIRLLLYHIFEVPWATQEIIVKNNFGEIQLFQVGTVHIMKGCK